MKAERLLSEETLVLTHKGHKKIKNISVGDRVLSHDGFFHVVTTVINEGKIEESLDIRAFGFASMRVSPKTQFYARKQYSSSPRLFSSPKWINIDEIKTGVKNYFFGVPVLKNEEIPSETQLSLFAKEVGVDADGKDIWYQFGRNISIANTIPGFILNAPRLDLKRFLDGHSGNPCRGTKYPLDVMYGLALCIEKVYMNPCSVKANSLITRSARAFVENGYIWYPIIEIKKNDVKEDMYIIEVSGSHSFVANHCILHD